MASNNLVRRLTRELTASPAKAAVLGGLLVVAIWFWIPLIVGKSSPSAPDASTTAAVPTPSAGDPVVVTAAMPTQTTQAPSKNKLKWNEAIDAMRYDERMRPAIPLASALDPFRDDESKSRDVEALAATASVPRTTPAQAGIQLTSTIVGSRKRTAMIGGKAYHEGDIVKGSKTFTKYKLVEIHPKHVVLEQGGERFPVWIPRAEPVSFEE